jgi:hypothetical protein
MGARECHDVLWGRGEGMVWVRMGLTMDIKVNMACAYIAEYVGELLIALNNLMVLLLYSTRTWYTETSRPLENIAQLIVLNQAG